jgi:hypothetical protein
VGSGKMQNPISKITNTKTASRVPQVVACLPSKHVALSSAFSNTKPEKQTIKTKHNFSPFLKVLRARDATQ